jgi:hypothetical protein
MNDLKKAMHDVIQPTRNESSRMKGIPFAYAISQTDQLSVGLTCHLSPDCVWISSIVV